MGSVLTLDKEVLRQALDRKYASHQQWKGTIIECSNSGVAHSSHSNHGGNRLERRENERRKWESLSDQKIVLQVLARLLNPIVDGSNPRALEITGKFQILQKVTVPSNEGGKLNPLEGSPIYVGVSWSSSKHMYQ